MGAMSAVGERRDTLRVRNSYASGFSPSTVADMTTNTIPPRDWGETVPLPELARVADVSSDDLYNAIRRGLLDPGGTPGKRYRPIMVPKDQATSVLMAAAISVASGVVFTTALRVVLAGATLAGARLPEVVAA